MTATDKMCIWDILDTWMQYFSVSLFDLSSIWSAQRRYISVIRKDL